MVDGRFDALVRVLASTQETRRGAFRFSAGGGLAALLRWLGLGVDDAAAAGCRAVGERCKRSRQCCSGRCAGRKGKKTCRARNVGTCRSGQNACAAPNEGAIPTCNGGDRCACFQTTGDASFCGDPGGGRCARCRRDLDCVKQGFPRGSACIDARGQICEDGCPEAGGTACLPPCPPGGGASTSRAAALPRDWLIDH